VLGCLKNTNTFKAHRRIPQLAACLVSALGISAWLIAALFALRFLKAAVLMTGGTQRGPLFIWSIVFLLVTLQMTTSLRPILGRAPAQLTQEKKFFIQHWFNTVGTSLQTRDVQRTAPEATGPASSRNPYLETTED
jgi:hypothetical protein